jgi:hypothetical protein
MGRAIKVRMAFRLSTLFLVGAALAFPQPRPKILGVSHIALLVSDVEKSRGFYKDFLGYGVLDGHRRESPEDPVKEFFYFVQANSLACENDLLL